MLNRIDNVKYYTSYSFFIFLSFLIPKKNYFDLEKFKCQLEKYILSKFIFLIYKHIRMNEKCIGSGFLGHLQ